MAESNTIFVDGLQFDKPRPGAPEFIKGRLSIHADRLTAFIAQHRNENGYLNVDLCKSAKGNLYLKLNTYKKPKTESDFDTDIKPEEGDVLNPDDIPF